jgi:carbonic anhydrase
MSDPRHQIPHRILTHEESVVVLITPHLYLESVLIGLVQHHFHFPNAFKIDRLSFPMKVDFSNSTWCDAEGFA